MPRKSLDHPDFAAVKPAYCGLELLANNHALAASTRERIDHAIRTGYTLRSSLYTICPALQRDWLGQRWMLLHKNIWALQSRWASIVSSRIPWHDSAATDWLHGLEVALRQIAREQQVPIVVAGTTTSMWLQHFLDASGIFHTNIQLPRGEDSNRLELWLHWTLNKISECDAPSRSVFLAPPSEPALPEFEPWALQDRVAIGLSHSVSALSVRRDGTIARLLEYRLADDRFPPATVRIHLPNKPSAKVADWLDSGAVGVYVANQSPPLPPVFGCRRRTACSLVQWTANHRLCQGIGEYLTHCVRGNYRRSTTCRSSAAILDAIIHRQFPTASPLATLLKVIRTGKLRSGAGLNRAGAPVVSFSAVPLAELVQRRCFQSHLGRWDWEPYGVLVRRDVLLRRGARPVIYGDKPLYDELSAVDRPFFQPGLRASARNEDQHWHCEAEWRVLGDVSLGELPNESIAIFVAFEHEAQALAARSPWPVIWLEETRTAPRPMTSRPGRSRAIQTSKN